MQLVVNKYGFRSTDSPKVEYCGTSQVFRNSRNLGEPPKDTIKVRTASLGVCIPTACPCVYSKANKVGEIRKHNSNGQCALSVELWKSIPIPPSENYTVPIALVKVVRLDENGQASKQEVHR